MTKTVSKKKTSVNANCTSFQLHKSQLTTFDSVDGVIDFTEKKLLKFVSNVKDEQQKLVLAAMISDYRDGNIAISWRSGKPIWVSITKDS